WEKFQYRVTQPSRGIYAAHTHTDSLIAPPPDERQGPAPTTAPVRAEPGSDVLARLKDRVDGQITRLLAADRINQMQMQFLAKAYHVKWTRAHDNQQIVEKLVDALDKYFVLYKADPRLAESDRETPNPDWFGLGPSGDVVRLLAAPV